MKQRLTVVLVLSINLVLLVSANSAENANGDIKVRIYRGNSSQFSETTLGEGCSLLTSSHGYKQSLPVVLVVHGMAQGADSPFAKGLVDAFASKGIISDYNVLAVHMPSLFSNDLPNKFYYGVLHNVQPAGDRIGEFLSDAVSLGVTSPDRIHLIGYSVGAQVAGYAARRVKARHHSRVKYIAGLDPAGFGFHKSWLGFKMRLLTHVSRDDATVTHFFHTNSISCGTALRVATADFVFNGGLVQPGCLRGDGASLDCSHTRIPFLFLEAILAEDAQRLVGRRCDSWAKFSTCLCEEHSTANISFPPDFSANGIYYLRTRGKSPFGMGLEGSHCSKDILTEEANEESNDMETQI